ncbi:hypothetical protein [Labrenzia sp. OB1]|uniref:hypothetical protein n=1 Tax=Labrenzia sp. OB1 TaxID=1561204 RepID=UPI000B0307FB|nr:hypothetical protein [Labrenzia sp. OB1]
MRGIVEGASNAMLDAGGSGSVWRLAGYERRDRRQDTCAGSYDRPFTPRRST